MSRTLNELQKFYDEEEVEHDEDEGPSVEQVEDVLRLYSKREEMRLLKREIINKLLPASCTYLSKMMTKRMEGTALTQSEEKRCKEFYQRRYM